MWSLIKDQLIVLFCIVVMSTVMACSSYSEGDEAAKESFEKMTVEEKSYYDKASTQWGADYLRFIRASVRKRFSKPKEDSLPFADIAKVIKATNDVTMSVDDTNWSNDTIKKKNSTKFMNINKEWYQKIIELAGQVSDKEMERYKNDSKEDEVVAEVPYSPPPPPEPKKNDFQENLQYSLGDLLPADEYIDLKMTITGCDDAIEYLKKVVSSGRPVTLKDRDIMIEKSLFCKSMTLNKSFRE